MYAVSRVSTRPVVKRRGAIAVIVCVLMVPLLAFIALSVDSGWITLTKSELQNAADSAAEAGARQLMDNYGAYSHPLQVNRSRLVASAEQAAGTYCTRFGGYNSAGNADSL
ncbi:MAG TPA: pilus assembly protein TadG-related protein, partial [Planctomycetaceae bacterium]|nr:pilus assembly protein TadG-related protein [Planctomycetaceae bacterium]